MLRRPVIALSCGALLLNAAAAQDVSWNIPDRGAAQYRRETITWRVAPVDTSRAALQRAVDGTTPWRVRSWPAAPTADGFQVEDYDASGWTETRLPIVTSKGPGAEWPESAARTP